MHSLKLTRVLTGRDTGQITWVWSVISLEIALLISGNIIRNSPNVAKQFKMATLAIQMEPQAKPEELSMQ